MLDTYNPDSLIFISIVGSFEFYGNSDIPASSVLSLIKTKNSLTSDWPFVLILYGISNKD